MNKFQESQKWLDKLASEAQFFRDKKIPTLDPVQKMLKALGNPDESFEWRVVVGGTAGKGTVCRLTEDVLIRGNKKVATLMSPHIQFVNERVRINGANISDELFGEAILEIKKISEKAKIALTYYEAIVLAGVFAAKSAKCEVLIAEVGLGGEFDAVNALRGKRIAALTFIGEDHMEILGELPEIAKTKAGIFTDETVLALSGEKEFSGIIAKTSKIPVTLVKGIPAKLNKKLSRKICVEILGHSDFEIQKVPMPARWEKFGKIILDGAHSKPRFAYILPKIKKISGPRIAILGMMENHCPESFNIIENLFDEIFFVDDFISDRPTWSVLELSKKIKRGNTNYSEIESCLNFVSKEYPESHILVLGSFYLCGKIRDFVCKG